MASSLVGAGDVKRTGTAGLGYLCSLDRCAGGVVRAGQWVALPGGQATSGPDRVTPATVRML